MVFSSRQSGKPRIWKLEIANNRLSQITKGKDNHADSEPEVTTDGKTVIYKTVPKDAFQKVPFEGGKSEAVYADNEFSVHQKILSPDGKYIAFTSYRIKDYQKKVQIALLEDNAVKEIIKEFPFSQINGYIWTPDGKSLTFLSNRNGVPNIWKLPLDGSDVKQITNFKSGRIFRFRWASDGKNLLIVRGIVNNDVILIRDEFEPEK